MDKFYSEMITAVVAFFVGAITFVGREILTNSRKIELLEREIKAGDDQRKEDRETMLAIKKEIRDELLQLREELHRLKT